MVNLIRTSHQQKSSLRCRRRHERLNMTFIDPSIRSYPSWLRVSQHQVKIESLLLGQHTKLLKKDEIIKFLADP